MKTAEFKTLINKIENATKSGELTKLENKVWNEQTFFTEKQWNTVLLALVKVAHEKGLLSLSSHHSELKAAAQEKAAEASKNVANDMPAVSPVKGLTYQQFIDYCKTKYTAGGDTYVECWDEKTFNEWVAQFGAMTKKRAQQLIKTNHAYKKEVDAMREWDNEEVKELKKKGGKHMAKKNSTPADAQPAQTTETPAAQPAEQPTAPVEVLKGEVINTADEQAVNDAIDRISAKVDTIGKGYLEIVGDVARLRKLEAWKITGHKNLYELCADKFGMAKGTVHNLEQVFKKYGDPETFKLTDACAGMSLREMLANIAAEKKAAIEETSGASADGDGDGQGEADGKKKGKAQTLIDVSWELAGDDWNVDAIIDEIRKQLEQNPDAKDAFPDGANVKFTITI